MKMELKKSMAVAVAMSAIFVTTSVLAAPDIRPGLWEVKMHNAAGHNPDMAKMKQAMEQMKAQLANLPPEQRAMMEQQMGNMGVSVSDTGGIRICLTKEDIKRDEIPMEDNNCKQTIKERSNKRWAATIDCANPEMHGEVTANFESAKSYSITTKGTVKEKGVQKPIDMTVKMVQVSDNCGAVKPRTQR